MPQHVRVKFGATEEEVRGLINQLCEQTGWDKARVRYVVDMDACTVKETAYAVSDTTADLPLHPSGPDAVQKLIP